MCMDVFPDVPCVCTAYRGQKMAWVPLELKLQMFVSYHVGAGNRV